jgi:thioredoxin-like negative regulator of GroEL
MTRTVELARERDELRAVIEEKRHRPEDRLAEVERELDERWAEQERNRAERQARIEELLAAYEPARDRTDALTIELSDAMEHAHELRTQLKQLRAAPESVHVRAARRNPENLKPSAIGAARARLRRVLALDY